MCKKVREPVVLSNSSKKIIHKWIRIFPNILELSYSSKKSTNEWKIILQTPPLTPNKTYLGHFRVFLGPPDMIEHFFSKIRLCHFNHFIIISLHIRDWKKMLGQF